MTNTEKVEEFLDSVSKFKSFNIKYNNTESNRAVHQAFVEYAWGEHDGSYLMAIKKLLENYSEDYRYSLLDQRLSEVEARVASLENQKDGKEEKNDEKVAF